MVLSLNTGSYVGQGRQTYGYQGGNRGTGASNVASSSKLNRIARDISTGYTADIEAIEAYLAAGKTDKAIAMYNALLAEVGVTADEYGYSLTEGQKASILTNAYTKATGSSFSEAIQESTHSSFVTGLIEGIPVLGWLFAEGTSDDEALAKASGTKVEFKDKAAETLGAVASGAAVGAAVGSFIPVVGTAVGAVIGGVASGIISLFK